MELEFDATKSAKNEVERGLGFAFAARIFLGRTIQAVDDRRDYGEVRIRAIGAVEGDVIVVVYTDRGSVRRIVSARLANKQERALWHSSA